MKDQLLSQWPLWFVSGVLIIAIILFIWDRIRMDVVALLVVLSLALTGIVTPDEAIAGFGASIVVTIAALFVVGEGLYRSGVAAAVGSWIVRIGGVNETRLLWLLMPAVGMLSAFMSSTGAVALFIPVVLSIARKSGMSVPRLMMPLAFSALIGGMLTLIGTPPNIVASGILEKSGHTPFGFFDFTPIGLVILLVGMVYLPFAVRVFIPAGETRDPENTHPPLSDFSEKYAVGGLLHRLQVSRESSLVGRTVVETELRTRYDVTVFGILRRGQILNSLMPVLSETTFHPHDVLLVYGESGAIATLCGEAGLISSEFTDAELRRMRNEFGLAEVMLRPSSRLIGQTIKEGRFRERFNLSVVGVRRAGQPLHAAFNTEPLAYGDTLLLAGGWRYLEQLERYRDFVVLETPAEMTDVPSRPETAPRALLILAAMVLAMVSGVVNGALATLTAAVLMILTGCVRLEEAYHSLNARSLVLIAGMLPLATAMQKTGAVDLICSTLVGWLGDSSPLVLCASFFVLTSLLSQVMSNTATTVLVAPIAIATAVTLGVNPAGLMMSVAIAASTAFATPIASPVNTLVVAPGNYRFIDFVKVGLPLQLLAMGVTLSLVSWLFPL